MEPRNEAIIECIMTPLSEVALKCTPNIYTATVQSQSITFLPVPVGHVCGRREWTDCNKISNFNSYIASSLYMYL